MTVTTHTASARFRLTAAMLIAGAALIGGALTGATNADAAPPRHMNTDIYQECIAAGIKTPAYCCALSGGIWIDDEVGRCVPPPPPPPTKQGAVRVPIASAPSVVATR
jgi:hypothetical protein